MGWKKRDSSQSLPNELHWKVKQNSTRQGVRVWVDLWWRKSQGHFTAVTSQPCPMGLTVTTWKAKLLIKYLQTINITSSTQWEEGKFQVLCKNKIGDLKLDWYFKKDLNVTIVYPWTLPMGNSGPNFSLQLICAESNEQFQSSPSPTPPTIITLYFFSLDNTQNVQQQFQVSKLHKYVIHDRFKKELGT